MAEEVLTLPAEATRARAQGITCGAEEPVALYEWYQLAGDPEGRATFTVVRLRSGAIVARLRWDTKTNTLVEADVQTATGVRHITSMEEMQRAYPTACAVIRPSGSHT